MALVARFPAVARAFARRQATRNGLPAAGHLKRKSKRVDRKSSRCGGCPIEIVRPQIHYHEINRLVRARRQLRPIREGAVGPGRESWQLGRETRSFGCFGQWVSWVFDVPETDRHALCPVIDKTRSGTREQPALNPDKPPGSFSRR